MANSAQALKRARQSEKSRQRNASQRSNMRTAIKKVIAAIADGDRDKAKQAYDSAVPVIVNGASFVPSPEYVFTLKTTPC